MSLSDLGADRHWLGRAVVDRDGEHLGRCVEVYADESTGVPEWLYTELDIGGHAFIPAVAATATAEAVQVAISRGQVASAPSVGGSGRLTLDEERTLYGHYELDISQDSATLLPEGAAAMAEPVPGTTPGQGTSLSPAPPTESPATHEESTPMSPSDDLPEHRDPTEIIATGPAPADFVLAGIPDEPLPEPAGESMSDADLTQLMETTAAVEPEPAADRPAPAVDPEPAADRSALAAPDVPPPGPVLTLTPPPAASPASRTLPLAVGGLVLLGGLLSRVGGRRSRPAATASRASRSSSTGLGDAAAAAARAAGQTGRAAGVLGAQTGRAAGVLGARTGRAAAKAGAGTGRVLSTTTAQATRAASSAGAGASRLAGSAAERASTTAGTVGTKAAQVRDTQAKLVREKATAAADQARRQADRRRTAQRKAARRKAVSERAAAARSATRQVQAGAAAATAKPARRAGRLRRSWRRRVTRTLGLGGFAAGYVLGARAGEPRYEQIVSTTRKVTGQ